VLRVLALLFSLAVFAPVSALAADTPPPSPDPDTGARQGNDATFVIQQFPKDHYRLTIRNTSGIGFINTFTWIPPVGMTVSSVDHTSSGTCKLASGDIHCTAKLQPPKCTCRTGGSITIDFTAKGREPTMKDGHLVSYGVIGSFLRIEKMTPVPYHIPSFLGGINAGQDLPLCKVGQRSTRAHPCARRK
jgi:hypothetical protein